MSNRIVILVLSAFFVLFLPGLLHASEGSVSDKGPGSQASGSAAGAADFIYDDAGKRDPFIPLVTSDGRFIQLERSPEESQAADLKLEGIIYDKYGISYAIVDGSVVKIGDNISDYQVLKIEENKVVFIKDGETREVFLKKED